MAQVGALNQANAIQSLVGNAFANQIAQSKPSVSTPASNTVSPEGDTVEISQQARDAAAQVNAPNRAAEADHQLGKFS